MEQASTTEPIDPTRFVFWLAFVLGSLNLLFSWLLARVPRPLHGADFRLDYTVRSSVAVLMLVSIVMARWLWKIGNPLFQGGSSTLMRVVLCVAWIEVAVALIGVVGIALSRR
jgi:hypothetical protein